jgi:hypothetical protein
VKGEALSGIGEGTSRARKSRLVSLRNVRALPSAHVLSIIGGRLPRGPPSHFLCNVHTLPQLNPVPSAVPPPPHTQTSGFREIILYRHTHTHTCTPQIFLGFKVKNKYLLFSVLFSSVPSSCCGHGSVFSTRLNGMTSVVKNIDNILNVLRIKPIPLYYMSLYILYISNVYIYIYIYIRYIRFDSVTICKK